MCGRTWILSAALLLISASSSLGIVVEYVDDNNDDVADSESAPLGDWDVNWDYVYNYKGSSAVAIDSYWLLTAAHVADDAPSWNMTIDLTTYTEQFYVDHSAAADPEHATTADLALVRVDNPLPGYYDIFTGDPAPESKLSAVLIGFGYGGTVNVGGASYAFPAGTQRIKRWGTNKIDEEYIATSGSFVYDALRMMFDTGGDDFTDYEAGLASYDSGGAVLVKDGEGETATWKLAGTSTFVYGSSGAYTGSGAVSVGRYETWINNTIPEPATLSLLAIGGLGILIRRKK